MKNILVIICILAILSCEEENISNKNTINGFYLPVQIECDTSYVPAFTYAEIDNQPYCSNNVEDLFIFLSEGVELTTAGPSTTDPIIGEPYSYFGFGIGYIGDSTISPPSMTFRSPPYDVGTPIKDMVEDVFIEGKTFEINTKFSSVPFTQREKNKFLIAYQSYDLSINSDFGAITVNGQQDGSYIRFDKVTKSSDDDYEYYDIEMSFECNLYILLPRIDGPPYLWGKLRNGRHKAKYGIPIVN